MSDYPSESSCPPLPFAPPHSATASCSKGRLIRCTVPGLTPKLFGNDADTRPPRSRQGLTDSLFLGAADNKKLWGLTSSHTPGVGAAFKLPYP
jgi:hypothetical protein